MRNIPEIRVVMKRWDDGRLVGVYETDGREYHFWLLTQVIGPDIYVAQLLTNEWLAVCWGDEDDTKLDAGNVVRYGLRLTEAQQDTLQLSAGHPTREQLRHLAEKR